MEYALMKLSLITIGLSEIIYALPIIEMSGNLLDEIAKLEMFRFHSIAEKRWYSDYFGNNPGKYDGLHQTVHELEITFMALMIFSAIQALSGILLCVSAFKKFPFGVKLWFFVNGITLFFLFLICALFAMRNDSRVAVMLAAIIIRIISGFYVHLFRHRV